MVANCEVSLYTIQFMTQLQRSCIAPRFIAAVTQLVSRQGPELPPSRPVHPTVTLSVLRSLPVHLAAIPERFSSSSLPPSFVPGHRAAVFTPQGTAECGALFVG
jgi:hypothetical protein